MSDAPERIWAGPNGEYWSTENIGNGADAEYVRNDRIEALEAENKRLREAQEWQPIETAPKDGTEILLIVEVRGSPTHPTKPMQHIRWEYEIGVGLESGVYVENPEAGWIGDDYNYWMPLPEAPKETDK